MTELKSPQITNRIETIEYTNRDLRKLLTDNRFWLQPRLPITKRRAISYLSNPRATEDDVVLIAAYIEGQLVAYTGILPDVLVVDGQTPVKMGWLSTWWSDKASNCGPAAAMVLLTAMKRYSNRVAADLFSADAKRIYDATRRFQDCGRLEASYYIMSMPSSFRGLLLQPFSRLVSGVVGTTNRIILSKALQRSGLQIRIVDSFDEGLKSFIDAWAAGDPLARDASYFEWALEFPWISSSADDEAIQKQYAFSAFAKEFRQLPLVISQQSRIIAFLLLTLRDGKLSLKYGYYDGGDIADVITALKAFIADINPWVFVCADASINTQLQMAFPFYFARRKRTWLVYATNTIASLIAYRPHLGVGDSLFT